MRETLTYSLYETPLFYCVTVHSAKGLRALWAAEDPGELVAAMQEQFSNAELVRDDKIGMNVLEAVQQTLQGKPVSMPALDITGSPFDVRVWKALCEIPHGTTVSYTQLAQSIGASPAVRAVANGCGRNPVALLIPCHRVLRSNGELGGYRWGVSVKQRLLDYERKSSMAKACKPELSSLASAA